MNKKPDFKAKLVYRTTENGGRKSFANSGYRPQVEFNHIPNFSTSGQQVFLEKESVLPGETVNAEISLLTYFGVVGNLSINDTFNFCEGSRIIGTGKIIEILNKNLENKYSQTERENLTKRIETAIELAKNGNILPIQNKNISFDKNWNLIITGFSKSSNLNSFSKEKALKEIEYLKNDYEHWLGLSSKFKNIKNWRNPKFVLSFLDGKNEIGICEVDNNKINWLIE
jgi:hypothetical protein